MGRYSKIYSKVLNHVNEQQTIPKNSKGKQRIHEGCEVNQNDVKVNKLKEQVNRPTDNVDLQSSILNKRDEFYELREQVKKQSVPTPINQLNEGLLNEPPNTNNSDPLTPLDQNFVTTQQLNDHYRLFINRIQQQLATIGGGGETQFKFLDDVVNFIFVGSTNDLPAPVNGIINLKDNYTYFFTTTVDLQGSRLVAGQNTTILGGSSENSRIKSTGISTTTALLSSNYSIPLRNITLEAPYAINLDATGYGVQALDWFGVNFTNCAKVGIISSYNNFIMLDGAFLSSQDLTFNGTTGTIGFNQCLFSADFGIGGTRPILKIADTANITRRFRSTVNSFVVPSGMTAISVGNSATILDEALILDTCNFSGPGSYLDGDATDLTGTKPLFTNNRGISNTFATGQIYMLGNTTQTSIASTDTWTKVAGITTDTGETAKFVASNNRLTCSAVVEREYNITASISFRCEATNNVKFGFYDSRLGAVRLPSQIKHTSSAGELHQVTAVDLITQVNTGNYIELHCKNLDSTTPITVEYMNMIVHEVG
jgi:hypothetical protein